jgi:hypothetical protein
MIEQLGRGYMRDVRCGRKGQRGTEEESPVEGMQWGLPPPQTLDSLETGRNDQEGENNT